MLWIALHLPALPLEAFAATLGAARVALPVALLEGHRIRCANRVALALGVQPRLKRATALALAPQLLFGQADRAREAQALRAVAYAALAFTPSVTVEGEGGTAPCVLLEVQGSLRYFGGLARLQQRLHAALSPLEFSYRLASAPTARGAALLARWRDGLDLGPHSQRLGPLQTLLDQVPVALLDAARDHVTALQAMGLHTLGDLRRLPRAGLARRFGDALLTELDRARDVSTDPRDWIVLPARFEDRLELFERTDSTEQVLHGATVLLARLVVWAQAQHARIGRFTLALRHEPRHRADTGLPEATALDITLAEATRDAAHLQLLLRERLARLPLPAPTAELRLHCAHLECSAAPNGELFPTQAGAHEGLTRLVERLQARLGPGRVQRPVLLEDHRPEHGTVWVPALPLARAPVQGHESSGPARPVWLLAQPLPLPERQSRPLLDGRPLQLLAGPERIESGWWDGAAAVRDYFIAQAHDAALVWIYRTRLPPASAEADGWFLHGRFG